MQRIDWHGLIVGIVVAILFFIGSLVQDAHSMDLSKEPPSLHIDDMRGFYAEQCRNQFNDRDGKIYKLCIYIGQGETVACAYILTDTPLRSKVTCVGIVLPADKDKERVS